MIQFSVIPEFSWWQTPDGRRLFCVLEKRGRGQGHAYVTTEAVLVERGVEGKTYVRYDQLVERINAGKLVRVYYSDPYVRPALPVYPPLCLRL